MIDFAKLKRSFKPNNYLVADRDTCPNSRADQPPATYDVAPDQVQAAFAAVVARQPRTREKASDPATMTWEYVQRSKLVGFPDTVTVQFLPDGEGTRVLIYSASKFGYSDLGVNRKRVRSWLAALDAELAGN